MDTSGSIAKTSSRNSSAGNRSRSLPTTPAIWTARRKSSALPHHGSRCAGVANVATPRIRSSSAAVARASAPPKPKRPSKSFAPPRRLDRGSSSGRLATASRRRYRCCHRPRERAGRDDPSRLGRHVLGQFRQETGRLTTHPHGARQTVHDDQRVTRERPRARRRDSKVQERGTALELLVSEHRARCLGAEPEVRGDRRGRRGTAPNSSRV